MEKAKLILDSGMVINLMDVGFLSNLNPERIVCFEGKPAKQVIYAITSNDVIEIERYLQKYESRSLFD